MNKELEIIKIYPKIHIYRNVFNDVDLFLEKAKKCVVWEEWYTFGTMLPLQEAPIRFTSFPTREEYINSRRWQVETDNDVLRADLTKELGEIFYDVTSNFLNSYTDISFNNWVKYPASINKYFEGAGITDNYAMNYHTDFVQLEKDAPGIKFGITTTFYLNDDYENGEICFKVGDDILSHKPKKGDVIVFPSSPPYYHAVRRADGTDRYMIRSFWQFDYEGSPEWIENENKYGKEIWDKMEKDRIKENRNVGQINAEELHKLFGKNNGLHL
jgi:hypothetical protein